MRIALIGGVRSTEVVLRKLKEYNFSDVFVFGYKPKCIDNVSSWVDLEVSSRLAGFSYSSFRKVSECETRLRELAPDLVFAVGLSQLIPKNMLQIPPQGFIGFHPTHLPFGRGRAPLAWLILDQRNGAATFFIMNEGTDDGPILSQIPFILQDEDDASSLEQKMLNAEGIALDNLLPKLTSSLLSASDQDNHLSTYYGKRAPVDGWLDWSQDVNSILRLIKASTTPHPSAYTFQGNIKIKVLCARLFKSFRIKGVVGRILYCGDDGVFSVQCGTGVLSVTKWSAPEGWRPIVGTKLGFYCENEIYELRSKVLLLELRIKELEERISIQGN